MSTRLFDALVWSFVCVMDLSRVAGLVLLGKVFRVQVSLMLVGARLAVVWPDKRRYWPFLRRASSIPRPCLHSRGLAATWHPSQSKPGPQARALQETTEWLQQLVEEVQTRELQRSALEAEVARLEGEVTRLGWAGQVADGQQLLPCDLWADGMRQTPPEAAPQPQTAQWQAQQPQLQGPHAVATGMALGAVERTTASPPPPALAPAAVAPPSAAVAGRDGPVSPDAAWIQQPRPAPPDAAWIEELRLQNEQVLDVAPRKHGSWCCGSNGLPWAARHLRR